MTVTNRHPDYATIARVVGEQDILAAGGDPDENVQRMMIGIADHESLRLVAAARANGLQSTSPLLLLLAPELMLTSIWIDAFAAGVRFQQAGGHTNTLED